MSLKIIYLKFQKIYSMTNLLSSLLLLCLGCSQGLRAAPIRDQGLEPYIDKFVYIARNELLNPDFNIGQLSYSFEDMGDSNVAGSCTLVPYRPEVRINTRYWKRYTELERDELIQHELGHCLLFRGHREDKFSDGSPKSIMFPVMMREYILMQRYEYYIHELFDSSVTENTKEVEFIDYVN